MLTAHAYSKRFGVSRCSLDRSATGSTIAVIIEVETTYDEHPDGWRQELLTPGRSDGAGHQQAGSPAAGVGASRMPAQLPRYARQLYKLWSNAGATGVINRLRQRAAALLAPDKPRLEVRPADVLALDPAAQQHRSVPRLQPGEIIAVNWVMTPPSPGSGGHTTVFRVLNYLQKIGYQNRVYFYDLYDGDHRYYESVIRAYYGFDGLVSRVEHGMDEAHAIVATAWPTAYFAQHAPCSGRRFYFVQDFEPYFYPAGTNSVLAENTYRMGFFGITAGRWLAEKLTAEFGMRADYFSFGCDTSTYRVIGGTERSGIVFYARPGAERRAFELGLMAMELFARRYPEVPLHFYGEKMGRLGFHFIDHGRVSPGQLNEIYNQCFAGLSLSMTNVSLVPHEMLAAGCIPVVNDMVQNRIVLDNPHIQYAPSDPHALAAAMEVVMSDPGFVERSQAAAGSVRSISWDDAGEKVDRMIRRGLTEVGS